MPEVYIVIRPGRRIDACRSPKEAAEKYQLGHAPALLPEDTMRIQRIVLNVLDDARAEFVRIEDVPPPEAAQPRRRASW